jgi:hypothetical protein
MAEYTIQLSDEQVSALAARAADAGVQPDEQLQAEVNSLFDMRRQRIRKHIQDIVRENKSLYERLA